MIPPAAWRPWRWTARATASRRIRPGCAARPGRSISGLRTAGGGARAARPLVESPRRWPVPHGEAMLAAPAHRAPRHLDRLRPAAARGRAPLPAGRAAPLRRHLERPARRRDHPHARRGRRGRAHRGPRGAPDPARLQPLRGQRPASPRPPCAPAPSATRRTAGARAAPAPRASTAAPTWSASTGAPAR